MIPNPHCLCSARAAAALRMGWIRHDAHRFLRNRRTFLMHCQKAAVAAADIAGARMRLPSVCLQSLNLFGKRLIKPPQRRLTAIDVKSRCCPVRRRFCLLS